MGRGSQIFIEKRDVIGRRIVEPAQKVDVTRDRDSSRSQNDSDLRAVEQQRCEPSVTFTGVTRAGAAVQPRLHRVVLGLARMPAKRNDSSTQIRQK